MADYGFQPDSFVHTYIHTHSHTHTHTHTHTQLTFYILNSNPRRTFRNVTVANIVMGVPVGGWTDHSHEKPNNCLYTRSTNLRNGETCEAMTSSTMKVKVRVLPCPDHEGIWRRSVIAPHVLNLSTRQTRGQNPRYQERVGGPLGRSAHFCRREKYLPSTVTEPWIIHTITTVTTTYYYYCCCYYYYYYCCCYY